MLPHNPYTIMLDELNEINDIDDIETQIQALKETQEYVSKLRFGYIAQPAEVDYSCEHQRAAYLLAYYPHYIEGVYHAIKTLSENYPQYVNHLFQGDKVRACFLGVGPGAEVLGWLAAINEFAPQATRALAYLFDQYHWYVGQIMTNYLHSNYWNGGKFRTYPVQVDLASAFDDWQPVVKQAIRKSPLIVMQNCLNDEIGEAQTLHDNIRSMINYAQSGTIFIIIDLNYDSVLYRMRGIEHLIRNEDLASVLHGTGQDIDWYRSKN